MKHVLILGAGKSSQHIIQYLAKNTERLNFQLTIADINTSKLESIYASFTMLNFATIKANDFEEIKKLMLNKDIVISMLPAIMHIEIAKLCLITKCHLITPSYVSEEMDSLDKLAKKENLLFFNELGFDPGIDHMTTMKLYHEIKSKGGELYSYKSYAGGLVAATSDNNPWNYKFSWNPRNVILAGQGGTIKYKENNIEKYIPFYSLFKKAETITLNDGTTLDAYANRDSLKYETIYGWSGIKTLLRGTLRKKGFCKAWDILVEMGLTDDSFIIDDLYGCSYYDFFSRFYTTSNLNTAKVDFANYIKTSQDSDLFKKFEFIGLFDNQSTIDVNNVSPAAILQSILEKIWKLESEDTDWVIMVHLFEYKLGEKKYRTESFMSLEGTDNVFTAMSRTVGMPIAYACECLLLDQIHLTGVHIPILPELYQPILEKLEEEGIVFNEITMEIN